ncbi:MAG: hypothetical protein N2559_08925 [Anaerolineae bacterium]|nr:hypothetical protein [Anaerolineae bacterium]
MGVLRFFASIVRTLDLNPQSATSNGLDEIAASAKRFSYIGNRRTLSWLVREEAEELAQRLGAIPDKRLDALKDQDSALVKRVQTMKMLRQQGSDIVGKWFGKQWEKDSGVFPDFLLGLDANATFGNGALIELKDSKGDRIASFNSTMPTRFKSLNDVKRISKRNLVLNAARLYDFPLSVDQGYLSASRSCFYLIRTQSKKQDKVKISLVEGSFFETLPKESVLERVWDQVLVAAGVSSTDRSHIVELLAGLEQAEIARSREIEKASIKPRLRLMAEVHEEAKIHAYPEIRSRTVNLVIKRENGCDEVWLQREFVKEGYKTRVLHENGQTFILLDDGRNKIRLLYTIISHKRNGEHIVLQYSLR